MQNLKRGEHLAFARNACAAWFLIVTFASLPLCAQGSREVASPLARGGYAGASLGGVGIGLALIVCGGLFVQWLKQRDLGSTAFLPGAPATAHGWAMWARWSKASAALVASLGFLVLVGWAANIPLLRTVRPHYVAMKANSALAFLSIGKALWLANERRPGVGPRTVRDILAGVAASIGALTVLEYVAGWNLQIDELLFQQAGSSIATTR